MTASDLLQARQILAGTDALARRCHTCLRPHATPADWDALAGDHLCWEQPCHQTPEPGMTVTRIVLEAADRVAGR